MVRINRQLKSAEASGSKLPLAYSVGRSTINGCAFLSSAFVELLRAAVGVAALTARTTSARGIPVRSSHLPKIIFPAVVCNTDVTETSIVFPIILRALSTTTIVPSSSYATPWLYSIPSFRMNTRMVSPGRTIGLSAFANSLMFSTSTPCSCATLFRLKSLVIILPS